MVDDTPNNLFVMQMLLDEISDIEIELKTALNGQLALQVVESAHQESFSHIFLDLHMPIMDGYKAVKVLR